VAAAFGGGAGVDGAGQLTAPSYTIQGNNYNNVGGALGALDTQVTTNTASIGTLNTNVAANTANIGTLNTQVASNTANIATNTTDIGTLRSQVNNGSIGLVQQDAATRAITVGKTTDGTVLDVSGTAGNRVITGVGAGAVSAISVDAVNGSQLYATNQNVAANTAAIASLSGIVTGLGAGGSPYLKSNSTGAAASAAGANANAIGSGASARGANSIALGTGSQATQSGSIAVGMNSASTGTNAIAIGTGATATGSVAVGAAASAANGGAAYGDGTVATASLSTAVGPNASATAANAVAIGSGSTNTVANTVSFGSAGNERRLTNVAAGINSTDAVNVGQLQSTASGFQSQIGGLQTQVIDNQREARRGIVAAVAVAPVLMPSAAGKTTVAFNTGFYRGESGVGIGVSHRLNFAVPTVVYGSYSNGGGVEHIGRAGMAVEF
jgi:autotransporter adhesin